MLVLTTTEPEETRQLGEKLGSLLKGGEVIFLSGPLGAGKTQLAKGIAAALKVKKEVTSPTFTLINQYQGEKLNFYHMDFYRLQSPAEAAELGLEEYFYDDTGVTVVEWGENIRELWPEEYLMVEIEYKDDGEERTITFHPRGSRYRQMVKGLQEKK